jgi:phosphoribosylaminoimidazole carboxylase (NCAIR synthetase)
MVDSVGSVGGGLLAAVMKNATASQDVEFAVLKKSQDVEKANGAAALELVASAAQAESSGHIDVHV